MKKTLLISFIVIMIVSVIGGSPIHSHASSFKDLKNTHWAYDDILKATNKGYFEGYHDGTFRPESHVSKAEAITLITRVLGIEDDESAYPFVDTDANWSKGAIGSAYKNGIINKADYGSSFKPNSITSRAELAKWMSNALAHVNVEYEQAIQSTKDTLLPIPEYYTNRIKKEDIPYVAIMMGTGIMTGFDNKEWRPNNKTTRAQMATVLFRLEDAMNKSHSDYIHLRELIEVGETGTNINTATIFETLEGLGFDNIRNKPVSLNSGGGHLFLNRLIFVDTPENKSIYANMFVTPQTTQYDSGYLVYTEKRLNPSKPVDVNYYHTQYAVGGYPKFIIGSGWNHGNEDLFGLAKTRNEGGGFENFENLINRVGKSYYWEYTGQTLETNWWNSVSVDDGSRFFYRTID